MPGTNPFDIEGLNAVHIFGDDGCAVSDGPVDMPGAVLYSPGCHGGLPVPGACSTDAEHSLDLPQTMLARGAQAYMANTGYGWGLVSGIGYSERLVEIFTEEMTSGGTVVVGDVFSRTKMRYVLEAPRLDAYDMKSLMQWTLYGLPMFAVRTGISRGSTALFAGPPREPWQIPKKERLGPVTVNQDVSSAGEASLPPYLMRLEMQFDLSAPGVYTKRSSLGEVYAEPWDEGCDDPNGCYYTLNGLVERGSGDTDLPIQPYLIFDSRMSGTSQHGVLWLGGDYNEETGWVPVIGELASNGGDGSNHGSAPRKMPSRPVGTTMVGGPDPEDCRPSDLQLNGLVVIAGEAVRSQQSLDYDIERTYQGIDLEVFYYNNSYDGTGNCDRDGPLIGDGPYVGGHHWLRDDTLLWAVPVSDTAGVWRVLVVYTDNTVDGDGIGTWTPVELVDDGTGMWRSALDFSSLDVLTYVVQAVDNHGNVS